jgi:hypothetical protein
MNCIIPLKDKILKTNDLINLLYIKMNYNYSSYLKFIEK